MCLCALRKTVDEGKKVIGDLHKTHARVKSVEESLTKDRAIFEQQRSKLEMEAQQLREISVLQSSINSLSMIHSNCFPLPERQVLMDKERATVVSVTRLKMEVEGLEKTISALEHDKQELVEKERATVVNVTRLEKDVEGLERTISALENEKKYWGNQLSAANDKLKRLEGVAQAGGRAMDTIGEEKEHLNQQLIIAETQLKMSRTAINPHEQELVEQTVRLALNAAAEREAKNLDQVQEKVEGIRNGLKMIQAAHTLDLEVLELRTANHNLTNQMGSLQSRIDEQSNLLKECCGLADEERAELETTLR
ncbi:hypothetical protein WAI453_011948 [Rhynchosporium graminicola]